jgi:hypothetical protein
LSAEKVRRHGRFLALEIADRHSLARLNPVSLRCQQNLVEFLSSTLALVRGHLPRHGVFDRHNVGQLKTGLPQILPAPNTNSVFPILPNTGNITALNSKKHFDRGYFQSYFSRGPGMTYSTCGSLHGGASP